MGNLRGRSTQQIPHRAFRPVRNDKILFGFPLFGFPKILYGSPKILSGRPLFVAQLFVAQLFVAQFVAQFLPRSGPE